MNQRDRVRAMLEQAEGGVTTSDFLNARLPRFSARIKELRDAGLVIETERLSASASRYTLRSGSERDGATLGGPETASRVSSSGTECHQEASRRQPSAADSGTSGGGTTPSSVHAATAVPSLFEMERIGSRGHY